MLVRDTSPYWNLSTQSGYDNDSLKTTAEKYHQKQTMFSYILKKNKLSILGCMDLSLLAFERNAG